MRKNGSRQEMRCSQTPNRRRRFSAFNVIDRELQIAARKVCNSITAAADSDLKSRLSYACDLVPVLFPVRPNVPLAARFHPIPPPAGSPMTFRGPRARNLLNSGAALQAEEERHPSGERGAGNRRSGPRVADGGPRGASRLRTEIRPPRGAATNQGLNRAPLLFLLTNQSPRIGQIN